MLFFISLLSLPLPPSCAACLQTRRLQQALQGLAHRFVPFHLVSSAPHAVLPFPSQAALEDSALACEPESQGTFFGECRGAGVPDLLWFATCFKGRVA